MNNINREEIHLISKHSNWSEISVRNTLKEAVYNNSESWRNFLKTLFITLGIGFTVAGIIFFFAYNWHDLHKFIKIGMIEGLVIITTLLVLFSKFSLQTKNILLTGASILVGVLFAVFGQIYQTGANAYDFFWGWTMAITLWVFISNFAPLWMLFLLLINTSFILYTEQVVMGWSEVLVSLIIVLMNSSFLIVALLIPHYFKEHQIPSWFSKVIAIAIVFFGTMGVTIGLFDTLDKTFGLLVVVVGVLFGNGIYYGLKIKSGFYLSIIPFGLIFIFSGFLIKISSDASMFFIVSLFVIGSVTFVIKNLIDLHKKWSNE